MTENKTCPLNKNKECPYLYYYILYVGLSVFAFAMLTILHSWLIYEHIQPLSLVVPVFAAFIVGFLMARNKVLQIKLTRLVNTDKLTSAYNRQYFDNRLEHELQHSMRYKLPLCVLYLDLDYFKKVNDQYGHKVGDSVLVDFSQLVTKALRESDIFARYGGEEFIIMALMADPPSAQALYNRISKAIEKHRFEGVGKVTFSAGIASLNWEADTLGGIIERADKALYKAKENGRNQAALAD